MNGETVEGQVTTRHDLETALIEKCWKDPEFKKAVMSDPKGTLERHTGQTLPPQVRIFIHEEDANTLHFSIPPAPGNLAELSDADLEKVAGGTDVSVAITIGMAVAAAVSFGATAAGVAKGSASGW